MAADGMATGRNDYLSDPSYYHQFTEIFSDDPALTYIGIQWPWPGTSASPAHLFNDNVTRTTVACPLNMTHTLAQRVKEARARHSPATRSAA